MSGRTPEMARAYGYVDECVSRVQVDEVTRALNSANVAERASAYERAVVDALAGMAVAAAPDMQVIAEESTRQYGLLEAVRAAGLVAAPSMGRDLEDAIIDEYGRTAEPLAVWRLVEAHYNADGAAALYGIVARAKADKDLSRRPQNLDEVMRAHTEGLN